MSSSKKRKHDSGGPGAAKAKSSEAVELDMQYFETPLTAGDIDDSNALVMGPKKKKAKDENDNKKNVKKKLSKKERKQLLSVVKRKDTKERRAELLETLSKHQATDEMLSKFSSITEVYSQNFKSDPSANNTFEMKVNSVKGYMKSLKKAAAAEKSKHETMEQEADSTDTDDVSTDEEVEKNIQTLNQPESEKKDVEDAVEAVKMETESTSTSESKDVIVIDSENQIQTDDKMETTTTGEEKTAKVPPEERKPAVHIPVYRDSGIQEARLKLPILAEEQIVMETINENPVVIICGETGSGKTTQVPQFLYEAGYAHGKGIIGITEPRRVAAISMSKRIAHEMNLTSREVSYQIRYEGNVTPDTKIKFLTDGVLLKEAQRDPLLTKYSVIIIDEAHERSVYTDILVGLLSIVGRQRDKRGRPLKLIIMSATLRVEDFTGPKLFRYSTPPPVIKVDARQFPVTVHFNRITHENYVNEAFRKVSKIHRTLPEGGILVFVTGQQEIHSLIRKLRKMFPYTEGQVVKAKESSEPMKKGSKQEIKKKLKEKDAQIKTAPQISLDNYSVVPEDEEAENFGALGIDDDDDDDDDDFEHEEEEEEMRAIFGEDKPDPTNPLYLLPLFSLLSSDKQARVFEPPPEGCRLCVVATNVAETSLTIPNIRYVVDSGKTKTKFFDKVTGVSTFQVTWVSKASADQRAGRAGRLGPGHCYRLYSSAVFEDFSQFAPPEITRRPLDDLVLQMKSMRIDKVANFPFPTPPVSEQIMAAEKLLVSLGALKDLAASKRVKDLKTARSPVITDLGIVMSAFPVSPRYAKMLVLSKEFGILPYMVALVSALSVPEVFENSIQPADFEGEDKEQLKLKLAKRDVFKSRLVGHSVLLGDMMVLLSVVGACEAEGCSPSFCHQLGVRTKAIGEIRKLRMQLTNAVNAAYGGGEDSIDLVVDPNLPPPSDDQILSVRKVVLGGLADHVARRNPPPPSSMDRVEAKKWKGSFQATQVEEPVYIHPESMLHKNYTDKPEFVVYQDMLETSRVYMRGLCCVESHWFPNLAPSYCVLSKPLDDPPPRFDQDKGIVLCHRSGTFGRCNWEFPPTELPYPDCVDCYRWFAYFLLAGEVIPGFKKYKASLVLTPSTMVKSWAKLQPKTDIVLNALMTKGVNSREKLLGEWKKNKLYLRPQYMEWLKKPFHVDIIEKWPLTS